MLDQDADFVSICDFARHYYREHKWQIVPLAPRSKIPPKGFPVIDLHKNLLDEDLFNKMWGEGGAFSVNHNCGVICGLPSGGLFVVDLDTNKPNSRAQAWWDDIHSMRPHPETPTQITGSGGTQIFFKMPEGMKCFNHKNAHLSVDFQGEGAYVVLPPSIHPNGKSYRWVDGMSPDDCELMVLPNYLIEIIQDIIGHPSGNGDSSLRIKTDTPTHEVNEWGKVVDGREDKMTRMIFRACLELYRECPIIPTEEEQSKARRGLFERYVDSVDSRIEEPGTPKHILLEREGRGITLFNQKWRSTMRQWDDKISSEAGKPREKPEEDKDVPFDPAAYETIHDIRGAESEAEKEEKAEANDDFASSAPNVYKLYTMDELEIMPPAKALVEDIIAENSLGFIFGAPGCGKTFIAMSLGLSIAYGFQTWFWGRKIEKTGGPVIYICSEGFNVMWNRMKAWKREHGIINNEKNFLMLPDTVNLTKKENVEKLLATLKHMVESHPSKQMPIAIFVDTVSRSIAGADENNAQEMSVFVDVCVTIKRLFNTDIIGVHHTGRAGANMRGSTALDAGSDYLLLVKRNKTDGNLSGTIEAVKIRAYEDGWVKKFELKKQVVALDGKTSLVAVGVDDQKEKDEPAGFGGAQETGYTTIGKKLPNEVWKVIFDEVEADFRDGTPWSEFKQSGSRYAGARIWNIVCEHVGRDKFSESDADFVLKCLTGKAWLVSDEYMHNKMWKRGLKIKNRPF